MSNFKKAVQQKLRFETAIGLVTVEDLFNLKLTGNRGLNLDTVAKTINKQLKESEEESFVSKPTTANAELQLKLDIVKEIIADKLQEKKTAEEATANKAKRDKLLALKSKKQDESLESLTEEEIDAQLAELK